MRSFDYKMGGKMPLNKNCKFAFTLAEMLITLGIIGVVATMTIPNLISNYRKHVIETRLLKFYTTVNQALKLAEYDYGEMDGWDELGSGFITDESGNKTSEAAALPWINKYLLPYLKVDVKKIVTNKLGLVRVYFPDGSLVAVAHTGWYFFPDASNYKETKSDDSELNSLDSKQGIKSFGFYFSDGNCNSQSCVYVSKGVQPYRYGWDGKRETLLNNKSIGCRIDATNTPAYCTALIQLNNWKIPSDYPFKL